MRSSDLLLPLYRRSHVFANFETILTAFVVLFLPLCRIFCVDRRYLYQDTGENIHSSALKPVLRDLPFFFSTLDFFAFSGRTVAKIRAKTCVRRP